MAHRLLRRVVEHLQERMACRETQLEARAEDMRDPVTKRMEMTLIRYNRQITEMEVRKHPDWRPRRSEGETEVEEREREEQRERLMAHRRKRIPQISGQDGRTVSPQRGTAWAAGDRRERGSSVARHMDWSIRDWAR